MTSGAWSPRYEQFCVANFLCLAKSNSVALLLGTGTTIATQMHERGHTFKRTLIVPRQHMSWDSSNRAFYAHH